MIQTCHRSDHFGFCFVFWIVLFIDVTADMENKSNDLCCPDGVWRCLLLYEACCTPLKALEPQVWSGVNLKDVMGKLSQLFTFMMLLCRRASKLCSCFVLLCFLQLLKVNLEKKISGLVSHNYCSFFFLPQTGHGWEWGKMEMNEPRVRGRDGLEERTHQEEQIGSVWHFELPAQQRKYLC